MKNFDLVNFHHQIFATKCRNHVADKSGANWCYWICSRKRMDVFLKWMQHFIKYAKSYKESEALLLLLRHSSHKKLKSKNAKEKFMLSACSIHKMHPLDISFFVPFNTFYIQVADIFKLAYLLLLQSTMTRSNLSGSSFFLRIKIFSHLQMLLKMILEMRR